MSKWTFFETLDMPEINFTENLIARQILEFPHCGGFIFKNQHLLLKKCLIFFLKSTDGPGL